MENESEPEWSWNKGSNQWVGTNEWPVRGLPRPVGPHQQGLLAAGFFSPHTFCPAPTPPPLKLPVQESCSFLQWTCFYLVDSLSPEMEWDYLCVYFSLTLRILSLANSPSWFTIAGPDKKSHFQKKKKAIISPNPIKLSWSYSLFTNADSLLIIHRPQAKTAEMKSWDAQ